jgi:hypothetical protein
VLGTSSQSFRSAVTRSPGRRCTSARSAQSLAAQVIGSSRSTWTCRWGPGERYLAIFARRHIPQPNVALRIEANSIQGVGDRYPDGEWRLTANALPYARTAMFISPPPPAVHSDLGFTALFVLPEPTGAAPLLGASAILLRRNARSLHPARASYGS